MTAPAMRWTVVRNATPAKRRATDTGLRARLHVRCVCGEEKILWAEDIAAGRSEGCGSHKCKARWEAKQHLLAEMDVKLTEWVAKARDREGEEGAA